MRPGNCFVSTPDKKRDRCYAGDSVDDLVESRGSSERFTEEKIYPEIPGSMIFRGVLVGD